MSNSIPFASSFIKQHTLDNIFYILDIIFIISSWQYLGLFHLLSVMSLVKILPSLSFLFGEESSILVRYQWRVLYENSERTASPDPCPDQVYLSRLPDSEWLA